MAWTEEEQAYVTAARQMVRHLMIATPREPALPPMEAIAEAIRIGRMRPGYAAYEELCDLATEV